MNGKHHLRAAALDNRRAALHVLKLFANRRMLVAQGVVVRPRHNNLRALCLKIAASRRATSRFSPFSGVPLTRPTAPPS